MIDCCDRSIISWKAGLHIQGCDIELMLQNALFERFGESVPPKGQLQLLHDNGPEYIEESLKKWNIEDLIGYFGEVDHLIPWQIDHLINWRPLAENASRSDSKLVNKSYNYS